MREDGGEIQKVVAEPILFFLSISPDGAWLTGRVVAAGPSERVGNVVVAFPVQGGRAVPLCADCEADWAPGGRSFVVRVSTFTQPRSLVIALAPGEALPRLPAGGLRSEADAAGLHVVAADDGFRYPGRDARFPVLGQPLPHFCKSLIV
jgi:hypothetical protein